MVKFMNIKKIYILFKIIKSKNSIAYSILIYELLRLILLPLNIFFSLIEKIFLKQKKIDNVPIIFVVGLHRSGATYIAQVLLRELNVYGLNNINNIFNKCPIIITKILKKMLINIKSFGPIKNFYGQTKNIFDINDNHQVWDQWFGPNHEHIESYYLDRAVGINEYFAGIYNIIKKPILSKNGRNIFAIEKLDSIFKKSLFIIVDRDAEKISLSTKKANFFFFNNKYSWGLKQDPELLDDEKQILLINNSIKQSVSKLKSGKFYKIKYEDFVDENKQKIIIKEIKDRVYNLDVQ